MSSCQTVNITANQTLRITLRRIVAKVDVTVNVASSVSSQITLQSISLVNAPKSCRYFGDNTPTMGFMTYAKRTCVAGGKMLYYLLENQQGVNTSINNPKYKSRENAPANGSYLHIEGRTKDKLLDYYIYLGENTTSDFNVYGNRNYTLTINIQGISQADWRVEVSDGTKINVAITRVNRSAVTYVIQNQFDWIASDNTLDVTVTLSHPSRWDVTIPIQGVLTLDANRVVIPEVTDGYPSFFPYPRITIPAGRTQANKVFYKELRSSRGDPPVFLFSACTITRFITDLSDRTLYNYISGDFPSTNGTSETIYGYPKT